MGRGHPWGAVEDRVLRESWQEYSERGLRALLPGRTWCAIYERAQRLGLSLAVPQGHEYVSRAARRVGVEHATLVRILRDRGVPTRPVYRKPGTPAARLHLRRYVDSGDVDEAVAAWLATETVARAAARRGLHSFVLWERMVARGIIERRGRGRPVRVTDEQVSRALEGYRRRGPWRDRAVTS